MYFVVAVKATTPSQSGSEIFHSLFPRVDVRRMQTILVAFSPENGILLAKIVY